MALQDGPSPAVALSLKVLFGDAFVAQADPALLASFETRGAQWGEALRALWNVSGGSPAMTASAPTASAASGAPAVAVAAAPVAAATPAPAPAPAASQAAPEPAAPAGPGRFEVFDPALDSGPVAELRDTPWAYEEVRDALVGLLEEATGYPAEVLDDDADLEADLAIDSVKQVEALGALREKYGLTLEDDFAVRDYRTIRLASQYMTDRLNSERVGAAAVN
jgi:acyl carrier protein